MPWALKPRMFTWEANAKSPTFSGTCGAENQIGCVLRPGIWPKPWKTIGRSTGTLEANSPPRVSSGHSAIGDVAAKTEARPSQTTSCGRHANFRLRQGESLMVRSSVRSVPGIVWQNWEYGKASRGECSFREEAYQDSDCHVPHSGPLCDHR